MMMVEDDHLDVVFGEGGDGFKRSGAAIDGQEEAGVGFVEGALGGFETETVAIFNSMWEEGVSFPTEVRKRFLENGGGRDAVDIVIPED